MTEPGMHLRLNDPVICSDGQWGELRDVVIDPASDRVTHLVIAPSRAPGRARLVGIGLAGERSEGEGLKLGCTVDELEQQQLVPQLESGHPARQPSEDPDWDLGVEDVISVPAYDGSAFAEYLPQPDPSMMISYDRIPKGTVEVRRSSVVVTADDHDAGQLDGFVVERGTITHVVVERGHLWGRHRIDVPITAVARFETDLVTLGVSKHELEALPSAPVHHHGQ